MGMGIGYCYYYGICYPCAIVTAYGLGAPGTIIGCCCICICIGC